ncbi:hemerythrin domain-containing protein [Legionella maioricensis]|uniref:Hemerythrin domain-containing protein n=1 Tax=Legionella maioricensis TaxID=2896528 RepID=A0A9X2CZK4_9GAMM|nr:hemerythrin domain-containing protein [Legionella maioricensis]MCL9683641.1 hemerythrin domain-containing protein [Legionella maioricensis]MCL9687663.1 hemerythrin domain-containing protein [Legionella maioricensis]
MNAIDFLIKEHNHVRQALAEIDNPSHQEETKRKMFQTLCQDLIRHETMEHQVWYPHFKNAQRLNPTVKHLLSEEKIAEKIIKQFDHIHAQQEWEQKFSKLKHDVEHHATEEEQKLFPEVKKLLTEDDLEKIGLDMFHFKQDYQSH